MDFIGPLQRSVFGFFRGNDDVTMAGRKDATDDNMNPPQTWQRHRGKVEFSPEELEADKQRYRKVVGKAKDLCDCPVDKDGMLELSELERRLGSLFDKSLKRYTEDEPEANYDVVLSEMLGLAERIPLEFKLFRYRHAEPGCMEMCVRFKSMEEEDFIIIGKMYYNSDCKVYKNVATRSLEKRMVGQVSAEAKAMITDSQSEQSFGRKIHELPSVVDGQLLAPEGGMRPVYLRYEFLRILLSFNKRRDVFFGRAYYIDLKSSTRDDESYGNGAFLYLSRSLVRETMTLYGGDSSAKEPLAFCEKIMDRVTIYGTRPLIPGTHSYSTPKMEDCRLDTRNNNTNVVAFHPWFRLKKGPKLGGSNAQLFFVYVLSEMQYGSSRGIMSSSNDRDVSVLSTFEPLYKVEVKYSKDDKRQQHISGVVKDYYLDAKIGVVKGPRGSPSAGKDLEVNVGPGCDPAMMLCIASCISYMTWIF